MVTMAPEVMPSASSRSTRWWSGVDRPWTTACAPTGSDDSGTALEVNVKSVQDIVQSSSGENRDRGDHGDNRDADPHAALADHDQEIRHARDEQRHHGQGDDRLHAGELAVVRQLEQPGGAVV